MFVLPLYIAKLQSLPTGMEWARFRYPETSFFPYCHRQMSQAKKALCLLVYHFQKSYCRMVNITILW